jgi:dienelactone hydrolase
MEEFVTTTPEAITFRSWNPYVPRDMARGDKDALSLAARGRLYRPAGSGPHPAVVVVQGLGGPSAEREYAYGEWLAAHGYAALVVDTFGSRGVRSEHDAVRALRVTTAMMLADAFGALLHLREDADIDGERIAVIGFSYGGMVVLLSAYERLRELYAGVAPGFAAHISLYGCSIPRMEDLETTGAPILLLYGRHDGNVSLHRGRHIADDLEAGGSKVTREVFDAYHQWDGTDRKRRWVPFHLRQCRVFVNGDLDLRDERTGLVIDGVVNRVLFLAANTNFRGYHIQRDEAALARSNASVLDFLARMGG